MNDEIKNHDGEASTTEPEVAPTSEPEAPASTEAAPEGEAPIAEAPKEGDE